MVECMHGKSNFQKIGFCLKEMSFGSSLKIPSLESQKSQSCAFGKNYNFEDFL
jgi:hypothetical protein